MSIKRIAELSGFSTATVSNALNGTGRVSAKTAERIKEIVKAEGLSIRPKKHLRHSGKKLMTFTIADKRSSLRHSTFNLRIFEGMQTRMEVLGHPVVLCSKVTVRDIYQRTKDSAGIVLMGHEPNPQAFVDAAKKPLVWASRYETGTADSVLENNREIARLAAEYLAARGHKIIGYLEDPYIQTVCDRGMYFAQFLRKMGIKPILLSGEGIFDIISDHTYINPAKINPLLTKMFSDKEQPTAFFSAGDVLTISVYSFLRQRGIRPMQDIDIISCNNDAVYMKELTPQPPTIDFNLHFMGERAADLLLWRIKNPDSPPQKILITPHLVFPDTR